MRVTVASLWRLIVRRSTAWGGGSLGIRFGLVASELRWPDNVCFSFSSERDRVAVSIPIAGGRLNNLPAYSAHLWAHFLL